LSDEEGPPNREGANSVDEAIREVPKPLARMIHHREHRGHREDGTKKRRHAPAYHPGREQGIRRQAPPVYPSFFLCVRCVLGGGSFRPSITFEAG
jgi:hypothetical protein